MQKNKIIRKTAGLPYKAEEYSFSVMWSDEDDAFIGRVAEFPSLAAHGDTLEDAVKEILAVVGFIIEDLIESGEEVPIPLSRKKFSGKLNLRMPKHLHRQLSADAEREGVSLNQLITTKLASR